MNQIVLVGRLTSDPEVITTENENKKTLITLAVSRPFKNSEGEYETDFIKCVLWNSIAVNTSEYCKKGDIVGVKGRLQANRKDGNLLMDVVVEKVTFLSSAKKINDNDNYEKEKEYEI